MERGFKLLEFLAKCPIFYLVADLFPKMWRRKADKKEDNARKDI